ncbi:iron permease [Stereum hirsutum FP-91666 SS1]|uniref:iron permease n=1 Tax=Stereum hirsutum (strain FP-91666) TaxID=721885 RepID=UPI0004449D11|nr:iron permease [Stereum hirsutum FP-91666 SS1]EIM85230.1 iron permease [Stereum hirsutum FP-91666 SS1]
MYSHSDDSHLATEGSHSHNALLALSAETQKLGPVGRIVEPACYDSDSEESHAATLGSHAYTIIKNDHLAPPVDTKRGVDFWLVFVANLTVDLLSALDLTAVSTALPTIVHQLNGIDFIWVGSAYTIASTAVLPLIGGLVSVFGRKPVLLIFIALFALGSAICGSSWSMNMLISGRAIQGFGGGGCIAITEIIYADIVPLPERGKFQGITASVWAFACAIGPPIGGALANSGAKWRWLFFLNLPVTALAAFLVYFFLHVFTPKASLREKVLRMDWIGLIVIISGTLSVSIALTLAGVRFPWSSAHILAPLTLGLLAIAFFFVVESRWAKEPTVPPFLLSNRTSLSGYIGTFFHGILSMAVIFYLPLYFQASKLASPIRSGIDLFGIAFIVPTFAIGTGLSVQLISRYRPQNYIGWALTVIGTGLLSLLNADSSTAMLFGFQVLVGAGLGIVWISTQFPILAPLPYSNNAHALAFFTFTRCFAQTWGTVIGGTILQNSLQSRLPPSFIATLPQGTQLAYSIIPLISSLTEPLKTQVRVAFAESAQLIWRVMIGISLAGLLSCGLMREVEMRTDMDETWALRETGRSEVDPEIRQMEREVVE